MLPKNGLTGHRVKFDIISHWDCGGWVLEICYSPNIHLTSVLKSITVQLIAPVPASITVLSAKSVPHQWGFARLMCKWLAEIFLKIGFNTWLEQATSCTFPSDAVKQLARAVRAAHLIFRAAPDLSPDQRLPACCTPGQLNLVNLKLIGKRIHSPFFITYMGTMHSVDII